MKTATSIILIAALLSLSLLRNSVWSDERSLWQDVVMKSPQKVRGLNQYGNALIGHDADAAIRTFLTALRSSPVDPDVQYNLGRACLRNGQVDSAIELFQSAIALYSRELERSGKSSQTEQRLSKAYTELGSALFLKRSVRDASVNYVRALELDPENALARFNLGIVSSEASTAGLLRFLPESPSE